MGTLGVDFNREMVRSLMRAAKLTQGQLARRAGMSRTNLSRVLNGKKPSAETVIAIARVLNIPIEAIGPPSEDQRLTDEMVNLFRPLSILDKAEVLTWVRKFREDRLEKCP